MHLHGNEAMLGEDIHKEDHDYVKNLLGAFVKSIELYKESAGEGGKPWVLFVCEDNERNMCDQKVIEVLL